jgi:hypothetical protein
VISADRRSQPLILDRVDAELSVLFKTLIVGSRSEGLRNIPVRMKIDLIRAVHFKFDGRELGIPLHCARFAEKPLCF